MKNSGHSGDEKRHDAFSLQLSARLRVLREEKRLSQEEVAHRAGISVYTYQKFEKGESKPNTPMNPQLYTLIDLADAFDIKVEELLAFS
ncbi:MAG: helix-turn-helix transcriptional regulator [Coriobacteriia bacterium]|nr:helix-turn-helix transcriptional regulator [Coriobacteriia bacterium]